MLVNTHVTGTEKQQQTTEHSNKMDTNWSKTMQIVIYLTAVHNTDLICDKANEQKENSSEIWLF